MMVTKTQGSRGVGGGGGRGGGGSGGGEQAKGDGVGEGDGGGVAEQSADALTGRGWWQAEQIESEAEPAWLGAGEDHGEN